MSGRTCSSTSTAIATTAARNASFASAKALQPLTPDEVSAIETCTHDMKTASTRTSAPAPAIRVPVESRDQSNDDEAAFEPTSASSPYRCHSSQATGVGGPPLRKSRSAEQVVDAVEQEVGDADE